MKIIAVECPQCRRVEEMAAACLLLEVGNDAEGEGSSFASWICGTCQALVALPVDLTVLIALAGAGAVLLDNALEEDRPAYPEFAVDGPAFTPDDVLDFHQSLADDTWLARALSPESRR